MIIIILLLIIVVIVAVLYKRKSKKKPVRLEKQVTLVDKIQNFMDKHYNYIFIIAVISILILLAMLVIIFIPGTESGIWYNGGIKDVI